MKKKEVKVLNIEKLIAFAIEQTLHENQKKLTQLETELAVIKVYLKIGVSVLLGIITGLVVNLLRAFYSVVSYRIKIYSSGKQNLLSPNFDSSI